MGESARFGWVGSRSLNFPGRAGVAASALGMVLTWHTCNKKAAAFYDAFKLIDSESAPSGEDYKILYRFW